MNRALTPGTIVLAIVATAVEPVFAGGIPQGDIVIELEPVAGGLTAPVKVTHAGDGSGRLFIVEQSGQIRVMEDGVLLPLPFLDIADRLVDLGTFFDERGLLGAAFHPDYEDNGRFFVRYSAPRTGGPDEPCSDPDAFIPGCHRAVVSEFHVSAFDPNLADADSEIILFTADEPQFNHNGGDIAFGPDGFLYFALGDGGGAHDGLADVPVSHGPFGNGQNIGTVLGAMIRIDVDPFGGMDDAWGDDDDDDDGDDDDGDDDDGDDDDGDDDDGGGIDAFLARTCTFGLDATQEVPPATSSGSGLACVTVDLENMVLSWFVAYQGLTSDVVASHFHGPANPGENAGVIINIGALSGGLESPLAGAVAITPDQASEILAGLWYVNVHTTDVPSGEIRGQVDPCIPAELSQPPRLYGIPADNPFVGAPGRDETYAYGFRNPYRFSFDDGPGGDGSLIVGDVGQNLIEEVDIVHRGGNYGWVIREGFSCFDPLNPTVPPADCADTGPLGEPLLDPIVDYDHGDGISVIGGFVYRGAEFPDLAGTYVFGDFSTEFSDPLGRLFYIEQTPTGPAIREFIIGVENRPYGLFLKGFGEDEDGNLYVCGSGDLAPFGTAGVVERLVLVDVNGAAMAVPVKTSTSMLKR